MCFTCAANICIIYMFYTCNTCVGCTHVLHMYPYTYNTCVGCTHVLHMYPYTYNTCVGYMCITKHLYYICNTCIKLVYHVFYTCITGVWITLCNMPKTSTCVYDTCNTCGTFASVVVQPKMKVYYILSTLHKVHYQTELSLMIIFAELYLYKNTSH